MIAPWSTIDAFRKQGGFSLKKLAEECGVSEQTIQNWKRGGRISGENLERLADIFQTTMQVLVGPPPCFNPARTSASSVREGNAPYPMVGDTPFTGQCRYPADCDLRKELDKLNAKVDSLFVLLSGRINMPGDKTKETG